MSFPKVFALIALALFVIIGTAAWIKKDKKSESVQLSPIEVKLEAYIPAPVVATIAPSKPTPQEPETDLPHANRVEEFFNRGDPKFPIVETITYRSRGVVWQKGGRPAWLSDYASHYKTSRHFIARSLNGKPDYFKQEIAEGDRFNILSPTKNIQFYLLIDTSLRRLWFYYIDLDTNERVLVKDYEVGLGRKDPSSESGLLTPHGKYTLGNRIAVYKPKMMGFHQGQREKVELVQVFGTRWIPFEEEISNTTAPARGFGIHGVPWRVNAKGELEEDRSSLGQYAGDGCIRLSTENVEEIFAIIITKPAVVELVKNFHDAKLPGVEK